MKRALYQQLLVWKEMRGRKPLILRGARQVGKTYLLEEFGKLNFKQVFRLNFERQPNLKTLFQKDLSVERIVREIEVEFNSKIEPQNALIIFDEIQDCPQALTSLKYFCEEEETKYFVAAAGSLLGLKVDGGSFPVGKVHFLDLFPMNFSEFLEAQDEVELVLFLSGLKKIEPISENLHQKCLDYLRLYFCVGGMPEAVKCYVAEKNLNEVREIQKDLLETYSNDFSKHAGKTTAIKITQVWEGIPKQLAKEQKRFMLSEIKKGARFKDYEEAISWLTAAKLCHRIRLIKQPEFPLSHFTDENFFKLIPLDVGILGALSLIHPKTILQEADLFKTFKGAFTESFVGQEIISNDIHGLYYWRSKYEAEVDYLVECGDSICPVEVKSGESGKLKSLGVYADKYSPKFRIRISTKNFYTNGDFINLPLYGVGQMKLVGKSEES